jgi:hypothetical protein
MTPTGGGEYDALEASVALRAIQAWWTCAQSLPFSFVIQCWPSTVRGRGRHSKFVIGIAALVFETFDANMALASLVICYRDQTIPESEVAAL